MMFIPCKVNIESNIVDCIITFQFERTLKNLNLSVYEVWNIRCHVFAIVRITVQYNAHSGKKLWQKPQSQSKAG